MKTKKIYLDLIQRMLAFDASERISIEEIRKHEWFKGETLNNKELIKSIKLYHYKAELKRFN